MHHVLLSLVLGLVCPCLVWLIAGLGIVAECILLSFLMIWENVLVLSSWLIVAMWHGILFILLSAKWVTLGALPLHGNMR